MTHTGISSLDTSIIKTKEWLKSVQGELHLEDDSEALDPLRATLRMLRDRMNVEEAVDLGSQLPAVLRGFYFESWRPAETPLLIRDKDTFLQELSMHMGRPNDSRLTDTERVARAVFSVISQHVSEGQVRHVKSLLPRDLQDLWSSSAEPRS